MLKLCKNFLFIKLQCSEQERQICRTSERCGCIWSYLADLRTSGGKAHAHYNLFYDPSRDSDALLPPAAALAPTLWPQFHLRWACPSEAQAGELEAQCRNMALKFSELQKVLFYFPYANRGSIKDLLFLLKLSLLKKNIEILLPKEPYYMHTYIYIHVLMFSPNDRMKPSFMDLMSLKGAIHIHMHC